MRYSLMLLLLVAACHSATAPDCVRDPKVPADTATVGYNGTRVYLNACPAVR